MRWLLVVLSIPVALAANATRIVGAALLGQYMGPQFAEGFFMPSRMVDLHTRPGPIDRFSQIGIPTHQVESNRMTLNIRSWARFSLVGLLLGGTLVLLNARTRGELVPPHKSLLAFRRHLLVGRVKTYRSRQPFWSHLARVSSYSVTTRAP